MANNERFQEKLKTVPWCCQ